jgi:hypothetical protein
MQEMLPNMEWDDQAGIVTLNEPIVSEEILADPRY